jgi:hypothetical protein
MKQMLRKISAAAALVPSIVVGLVASLGVVALVGTTTVNADCDPTSGISGAINDDCTLGSGQQSKLVGQGGMVTDIINIMLFVIGILCVIMIIWAFAIPSRTAPVTKSKMPKIQFSMLWSVWLSPLSPTL